MQRRGTAQRYSSRLRLEISWHTKRPIKKVFQPPGVPTGDERVWTQVLQAGVRPRA